MEYRIIGNAEEVDRALPGEDSRAFF